MEHTDFFERYRDHKGSTLVLLTLKSNISAHCFYKPQRDRHSKSRTAIFAVTADPLLLKEAEFLNIRKQSVPLIIKTEQEAVISRLLLCFGLSILYCSFEQV